MNLRATYDRDFPGPAGGSRHIECFGSPMTGRFCLWCPNCRRGWQISVGRSPVVIRIGVIVIARDDDEAIAEVVMSIVISVVISGVEATAHVSATKVVHTTVAGVRVSVSSQVIAGYGAADRSAADMSSIESTATSTANVAPSESAATSKAAATAVSGSERVRSHRGTECNSGEEDHARNRLLLEVLKEVHDISSLAVG
jgi:hypothetical protein